MQHFWIICYIWTCVVTHKVLWIYPKIIKWRLKCICKCRQPYCSDLSELGFLSMVHPPAQSPCTAPMVGNLPAVGAVQGGLSGAFEKQWKLQITQNSAELRSPRLYWYQPITQPTTSAQWRPCLIPHAQSYSHQAKTVLQSTHLCRSCFQWNHLDKYMTSHHSRAHTSQSYGKDCFRTHSNYNLKSNAMFHSPEIIYINRSGLVTPYVRRQFCWYVCDVSYYYHKIGSIDIPHCCHTFPWLCMFPLLRNLWYVQMIGYIMGRSYSFVCTSHFLIVIIIQTYLKALDLWMLASYINTLSFVYLRWSRFVYAVYGAACFQFTHISFDYYENICISFYHHHPIESMNHWLLFRVRS